MMLIQDCWHCSQESQFQLARKPQIRCPCTPLGRPRGTQTLHLLGPQCLLLNFILWVQIILTTLVQQRFLLCSIRALVIFDGFQSNLSQRLLSCRVQRFECSFVVVGFFFFSLLHFFLRLVILSIHATNSVFFLLVSL